MKQSVLLSFCVIFSISDAHLHLHSELSSASFWDLIHRLIPQHRPIFPPLLVHPVPRPYLEPKGPYIYTTELPPQKPTTKEPEGGNKGNDNNNNNVVTAQTPVVIPDDHKNVTADQKAVTDHNVVTDSSPVPVTDHVSPSSVTEPNVVPTDPGKLNPLIMPTEKPAFPHTELKQEILKIVAKITDILLIVPKKVHTVLSVLLPILGNLIDIILGFLGGKAL